MNRHQKRLQSAITEATHVLYPRGEQDQNTFRICKDHISPSAMFDTPEEEMVETYDLPAKLAFFYTILPQVSSYILAERAAKNKIVTTMRRAREFLLPVYLHMPYEYVYMFCLTKTGKLLRFSPLRKGSIDQAPFYTRIILEVAFASKGEAFVLAHNHPGGIEYPSTADCQSTLGLMIAMSQLDMILVDHLIFTDGRVVSMRDCSTISRKKWNTLAPLPEAFRDWLR